MEKTARTSERTRKTRARVVGIGMDDAGGHIRFTNAEESILLFGGSEDTHREMQRRAARIQKELDHLGISLASLTPEQGAALSGMVERANAPETP